jgi:hypothetical protein
MKIPTFWRNILSPSSGLKSAQNINIDIFTAVRTSNLMSVFVFWVMTLCGLVPDHTASQLSRQRSTYSALWQPQTSDRKTPVVVVPEV